MLLLWIPIILIGATSIVGTIYYFKKREFFLEHKSFVEFWGIVLSILFALFAFLQTQSSMESSTKDFTNIVGRMDDIISKAEESSTALQNVEESLSNLPPQLNALSESINSFDDVISTQRKQMTVTLNELNSSVLAFKTTVDTMIERFNRKPDLDIELLSYLTDSTRVIYTIVVTNRGKLLADIYKIRFMIDTTFVKLVTLANKTDGFDNYVNYQMDYISPAPVFEVDRHAKFECNIILKKIDLTFLRVIVFYRASFGNDGTKKRLFVFKRDQDNYLKIDDDKVIPDPNHLLTR